MGRQAYGHTSAEKLIIKYIKRLRNVHHGKVKTFGQVAAILNADLVKYPPPRGKLWYATSIEKIIARNEQVEKSAKRVKKLGVTGSQYLTVRQSADLYGKCNSMLEEGGGGTLRQKRAGRIILTLLLTGIRRQELCDLRIMDMPVSHGKNSITVRGKGKTIGTVKISPWTRTLLDRICGKRKSGFVFKNENGKKYDPRSINGILKGAGRKVNLLFLHPHLLRHTYASILVWCGCDIAFVKGQLRHANIATTDVYTGMLEEVLSDNPPDHITGFLKAINPRHTANADIL